MTGDDDAAWAAADQEARTRTYHPDQQFTSDVLFQVPPDPMFGCETADGPWSGVASLPLAAFRPKDVERLFVLGGRADVSREQAEKLVRPLALIDLGERLGTEAAAEAQRLPAPAGPSVRGQPTAQPAERGEVRELLGGVRPNQQLPTIPQAARALPVLGRYDVVVIGGGTAGAPAGIAAARQGAKTLVVEQLCGLGGVGTTGAISNYCAGNRVGFTASVGGGNSWIIEQTDGVVAPRTAAGRGRHLVRQRRLRGPGRSGSREPGAGRRRRHAARPRRRAGPRGRRRHRQCRRGRGGRCGLRLHRRVGVRHARHGPAARGSSAPPTPTPITPTPTKPIWSTSGICSSTPRRSTRIRSTWASWSTRGSGGGSSAISRSRSSTRSPAAPIPTRSPSPRPATTRTATSSSRISCCGIRTGRRSPATSRIAACCPRAWRDCW